MIEDYAKHAAVWDWDGYDNTPEYEYWGAYAARFGQKVLIPMCALGQAGAYLAQKGFHVTAFDLMKEMIDEGRKRFGSIEALSLEVADICDLHLGEKAFDFAFLATQDLHLLPDMEAVGRAFGAIAAHLKKGACFALELVLGGDESFEYPTRVFQPRVPNYTDKKVWKEGKGRYDAAVKKHYIDQIVYIQTDKGTESFDYAVVLQYFERQEILHALRAAGFAITGEYGNRNKDTWTHQHREWIIEAIKQ